jgi:hypothetical protein
MILCKLNANANVPETKSTVSQLKAGQPASTGTMPWPILNTPYCEINVRTHKCCFVVTSTLTERTVIYARGRNAIVTQVSTLIFSFCSTLITDEICDEEIAQLMNCSSNFSHIVG